MRTLALACLLLPSVAAAQSAWPTTRWTVRCTAATAAQLEPSDCDDRAITGPAALARDVLQRTSVWLSAEGFRAPSVERASTGTDAPYLAWVSIEENVGSRGAYYPDSRRLTLDANSFFSVVGVSADSTQAADAGYMTQAHALAGLWQTVESQVFGVAAHELFHAVQNSYHSGTVYTSHDRDWIWEGTARYIQMAAVERELGRELRNRTRDHDVPLHILPPESIDAYNTVHFWRWLGQTLGGPQHVGFLRELLEANLTDTRGLSGLHAMLQRHHPDGLAYFFPRFIAEKTRRDIFFSRAAQQTHRFTARRAPQTDAFTATVEPVAGTWHEIVVSAPANETVGVSVRFVDDHPDLHLSVDDVLYNEDVNLDGQLRNVYRAAWRTDGSPDTLRMRVANVAPTPSATTSQLYALDVEVSLLDPCSDAAMTGAISDRFFLGGAMRPEVYDERDDRGERLLQPGRGALRFAGLVSDGGDACTFNVGEVSLMGQAMSGAMGEADLEAAMRERAEALQRRVEGMDPAQLEAMARRAEAGQLSAAEMRQMMDVAAEAQGLLEADGDARSAVLHVFSPHLVTWQTGFLSHPFATEHGGMGGWGANAAGHLFVELPGTAPEDLRRGQTYRAVAVAPDPDAGDPMTSGNAAPTFVGFYTAWDGRFQHVPYPPPTSPEMAARQAESRQACRALRAQLAAQAAEMRADGMIAPDNPLHLDCQYEGLAFEGEVRTLSGRLEGTVTIASVTGGRVSGTLALDGQGALGVQTSRFTYDGGRLTGEERTESRQSGPVRVSGSFEAPAVLEGVPRGIGMGMRTVRLGADRR